MGYLIDLTVKSLGVVAMSFSPMIASGPDTSLGDSLPIAPAADSTAQEKEFQEDLNKFFSPDLSDIDTSGWCTNRINTIRFDYKSMTDTVRLALVDSSQTRFYEHPFKGPITSPFGPRGGFWHFGTDIKVKTGDTIRCAFDGIVRVVANDRRGYGKVVVIRHRNGLETLYGHLSRSFVVCNQRIMAGEVVGRGGNTGRSTGSHLHFEMRYCGEPFDPGYIIDFETGTLKRDTLALSRGEFDYLTELRKTLYHAIRRGETLGRIARRYGTNIRSLCAHNRITPRTLLKVGRKIIVRKDTAASEEVSLGATSGI